MVLRTDSMEFDPDQDEDDYSPRHYNPYDPTTDVLLIVGLISLLVYFLVF